MQHGVDVTLQSAENARLWRAGVPGNYFRIQSVRKMQRSLVVEAAIGTKQLKPRLSVS